MGKVWSNDYDGQDTLGPDCPGMPLAPSDPERPCKKYSYITLIQWTRITKNTMRNRIFLAFIQCSEMYYTIHITWISMSICVLCITPTLLPGFPEGPGDPMGPRGPWNKNTYAKGIFVHDNLLGLMQYYLSLRKILVSVKNIWFQSVFRQGSLKICCS